MLYHNPDIVTGYNIFGFDFDYISKRVKKFNKSKNPYSIKSENETENQKKKKRESHPAAQNRERRRRKSAR